MKEIKINDVQNLSHTIWNCKYHIVFTPKYRRKIFYRQTELLSVLVGPVLLLINDIYGSYNWRKLKNQ